MYSQQHIKLNKLITSKSLFSDNIFIFFKLDVLLTLIVIV